MTHILSKAVLIAAGTALMAIPASAQSTEEAIGTATGGTLGAVIGGELDKKGSSTEGQIIGGVVGGTLGYVIGDKVDDANDRDRRLENRSAQRGEFYLRDDRPYRRYYNDRNELIEVEIRKDDPYFYRDGRTKAHPVFDQHPGRGKGLKKRR